MNEHVSRSLGYGKNLSDDGLRSRISCSLKFDDLGYEILYLERGEMMPRTKTRQRRT